MNNKRIWRQAGMLIVACLLGSVALAHSYPGSVPPYGVRGPLTEPRLFAEGTISTRDDEFGGVFTPDGKTCLFSISVPRHYLYVILISHFVNGKWSTPEVAPFSGKYRDFDPVFSPDG